jgi:outer membrane protein
MKKFILAAVVLFFGFTAFAQQKFAYVDSEYILKHVPEYVAAQKQLDDLSVQWQKDVDKKYEEIEKLYKAYQAEQVLLTEDMRKKREQEIVDKEKAAKEFQKLKFGFEGDLFKRRQELVKPIQDRIYDAIQKFSEEGGYGIVFDKTSELIMLYSSPKLDKSDDIVVALGYKPGAFAGQSQKPDQKKK